MHAEFGLFIDGRWRDKAGAKTKEITDPAHVERLAVARIEAGMIGINSFALAAAEAPSAGINYSGMRRKGGPEGIAGFMNTRLGQVVPR